MKSKFIQIGKRKIGADYPPFVIAEIGINHGGNLQRAKKMINDAHRAGAECVKFQCHIVEDEMIPEAKKVIPSHTKESIWKIMEDCSFSEKEEKQLKSYVESLGMIYLSTPFSRAAADRLEKMGIIAYKIGSGECNNYPLIEHIASFGKPIILSTGMNDVKSIKKSIAIFKKRKVPYAILHCVSMYPTPYNKVNLGAIADLKINFPEAVVGLSDHSLGIYTCLGAVSLGAAILEKHFTSSKNWEGADIAISIDPGELKQLIEGSRAIHAALGGKKQILSEEQPVINFAYASVVSTRPIKKGDMLTKDNIWVKRPGTGEIRAEEYPKILGKKAKNNIKKNQQLKYADFS